MALLKPWGLCYEYLTQATVKKYFAPIIVSWLRRFLLPFWLSSSRFLEFCSSISRSIDRERSENRNEVGTEKWYFIDSDQMVTLSRFTHPRQWKRMSQSRCPAIKNDSEVDVVLIEWNSEVERFPAFRLLQTNSFSGKMNALNEVNKLIMGLSSIQRATINRTDEPESLTAEKLTVRSLLSREER